MALAAVTTGRAEGELAVSNITGWRGKAGATAAELADLAAASGWPLPDDDLSFLQVSNGGEGELSVPPLWLVLHDAAFVTQGFRDASARAFFPGLRVIGSNGAGEAIAFDLRDGAAGGIVCFDMANSDLTESVRPVAASVMDLMALVVATGDCPPPHHGLARRADAGTPIGAKPDRNATSLARRRRTP